ncbi:hypothetical protein [Hyphomicrobium sp.]|uniref:hypothetical protein n=1 Tax=Hyphomicrobium sp. TaxID=82 RepID=UPI0025B97BFE|nr:hypothetical protein [Hyphomicrobium sp.]MCC7251837.1 hypothetical protein [Hyphomicrobium sp.]
MSNLSRRSLLSGGLRAALGAGGLILPWTGGSALAVVDRRAAEAVAVAAIDWPVSEAMLKYRGIREDLITLRRPEGSQLEYEARHILLWRDLVEAAEGIWREPVKTWSDVAVRAEIAWTAALKEADGCHDSSDYERLLKGNGVHWPAFRGPSAFSVRANAELIEAVLCMTGGERVDIRTKRAQSIA